MRLLRNGSRVCRLSDTARRTSPRRSRGLAALLAVALTGGGLLPLATSGPATAEAPRAAAVRQVAPAPGTTMSGAAMSDTAVYLAYTSSQQDVILRNVASAVPTTVFLGGRLIGGPALAVAPAEVLGPDSALVVFGRGTDNARGGGTRRPPDGRPGGRWVAN